MLFGGHFTCQFLFCLVHFLSPLVMSEIVWVQNQDSSPYVSPLCKQFRKHYCYAYVFIFAKQSNAPCNVTRHQPKFLTSSSLGLLSAFSLIVVTGRSKSVTSTIDGVFSLHISIVGIAWITQSTELRVIVCDVPWQGHGGHRPSCHRGSFA